MQNALLVFSQFDFLWLEDMNGMYKKFDDEQPDVDLQHTEVERLLGVEEKINAISDEVGVKGVVLDLTPIKDSLSGFCTAWKMCYVHKLHSFAEVKLRLLLLLLMLPLSLSCRCRYSCCCCYFCCCCYSCCCYYYCCCG